MSENTDQPEKLDLRSMDVADEEPLQFICLDAAFEGNDQLKTNTVQTFKARSQSREEAIVFRTV